MNSHDHHLGFFEHMHTAEKEPFRYSTRAIEIIRHRHIAELIRALQPANLLEIGCSLGLLTEQLRAFVPAIVAVDLSPTALRRAHAQLQHVSHGRTSWLAASVLALPLAPDRFDVVLASDGPMSWYLDESERAAAYRAMRDVVKPRGHAVITEYLRPRRFDEFVREIAEGGWSIEDVHYLYNRPWYHLEDWLAYLPRAVAQRMIGSVTLAEAACRVSRLAGRSAAHHILVTARRN